MAQVAADVTDYIAARSILTARTQAADVYFDVGNGCNVCLRIQGATAALAGAETVAVYYLDSTGTYLPLVDAITGAAVIAAAETTITIAVRGRYRASKSATAAQVGLEIVENNPS